MGVSLALRMIHDLYVRESGLGRLRRFGPGVQASAALGGEHCSCRVVERVTLV